MDPQRWTAVDTLIGKLFVDDATAVEVQAAGDAAGLQPIAVSPPQGKFLHLLVRLTGARRVLEIGALAGYSAVWMARALPDDGRLVTLELDEHAAAVARDNAARAGVGDRVEVVVGPADDSLAAMDPGEPFDLVFIDADKTGYPAYLTAVLRLARPGSVILADNVVRDGAVADEDSDDERVVGVRRFLEQAAGDPRLDATVIQTVGAKGYDGFCLAIVR